MCPEASGDEQGGHAARTAARNASNRSGRPLAPAAPGNAAPAAAGKDAAPAVARVGVPAPASARHLPPLGSAAVPGAMRQSALDLHRQPVFAPPELPFEQAHLGHCQLNPRTLTLDQMSV